MFFMSNNDLPCILSLLLEAETFNFQRAIPNPAFSFRNKNAPSPSLYCTTFVGGAGPSVSVVVVVPCAASATQLSKVIVYRRDQCLHFIYSDNLKM